MDEQEKSLDELLTPEEDRELDEYFREQDREQVGQRYMETYAEQLSKGPLTDEMLGAIERRANLAAPAPWGLGWDSCDCGGDYPCGHGDWPYEVLLPVPKQGYKPDHPFANSYSEVSDFSEDTLRFIVHTRVDVPALVTEIRRLREALKQVAHLERQAATKWGDAFTAIAFANPDEVARQRYINSTYEATRLHTQAMDLADPDGH